MSLRISMRSRLKNLKAVIDRSLDRYLPKSAAYPRSIHGAMRYGVFSGGKRIRPILVIESCRACGGSVSKALPAACAMELVHAYSLIHDDLPAMDDDDTRRGKPTVHKKYDEATAILAGDALFSLAFMVVARHSRPELSHKIIEELASAAGTFGMIGGQVVDLEYMDREKTRTLIDYINAHKTARLFEASCKIGALAAGAKASKVDALARFGRLLGISFQIVDDILDEGDYVRAFGRPAAEKDARSLANKAKGSLGIFGKSAATLTAIADYMTNRNV